MLRDEDNPCLQKGVSQPFVWISDPEEQNILGRKVWIARGEKPGQRGRKTFWIKNFKNREAESKQIWRWSLH